MKTRIAVCLLAALCIAGCVPTVNPVYREDQLVLDSSLHGNWQEIKSKELWKISKGRRQNRIACCIPTVRGTKRA